MMQRMHLKVHTRERVMIVVRVCLSICLFTSDFEGRYVITVQRGTNLKKMKIWIKF